MPNDSPRELLCELTALAYDRRLLDSAGGNFSARLGGTIYWTPRYAGSRKRWRLTPEDILLTDEEGRRLEGIGELSRESRMHLGIYAAFAEAGGVCHAHPLNALIFASAGIPIESATEQTDKYGTIRLCEPAAAHSPDLASHVVAALEKERERFARNPVACLIPRHGIVVAGKSLEEAYDALERIDGSAYVHAMRAAMGRLGGAEC